MNSGEMITIVVPVYNNQEDLPRCVQSLVEQDYKNTQIILIDDGSKDDSGKICDHFAEQYDNVEVIHQKNSGVSAARNSGIEHAKGEYLCFVDSDDTLEKDALTIMHNNMIKYNADISMIGYKEIWPHKEINYGRENEVRLYSKEEVLKEFLPMNTLSPAPWGKLIKRKLYEKVLFDREIAIAEDKKYNLELLCMADVVCYEETPKYNYYIRVGSATKSSASEKHAKAVWGMKEVRDRLKKEYPSLEEYAEVFYGVECINFLAKYYQGKQDKNSFMRSTEKECVDFLKACQDVALYRKYYQLIIKMIKINKNVYSLYVKVAELVKKVWR